VSIVNRFYEAAGRGCAGRCRLVVPVAAAQSSSSAVAPRTIALPCCWAGTLGAAFLDDRADHDLVLGERDAAELDGEPLEMLGTAQRVGLGPCEQRHRVEPVQDPSGEPDGLRELIVEVDRVVVS
jgi:hypothetical protein